MKNLVLACIALAAALGAQTAPTLSLAQAEQIALANHPQLQVAQLGAAAAAQDTRAVRSAYMPTAVASLTGAAALAGTRLAAGAINNPTVFDRYANGVSASQLITDFGRTSNLVSSARLHAQAAANDTLATRAEILVAVAQAFDDTLRAQALLQVAQETVQQRQTVDDQISALARSQLKSGLDLSFANVNLAQARLALATAQSGLQAARAQLTLTLGLTTPVTQSLQFEATPPPPPDDVTPLIQAAEASRPELAALNLQAQSEAAFARSEGDLARPTISAVASAGEIPWRASALPAHYAAAGANVNIPIFNGFLFSSRQKAANLRAQAAAQQLRALEQQIDRDVRVAWLNARTAFARVGLTQQLLDEATQALQLAQSRYNLGLSSIVELSQAQLNLTQAQTQHTDAIYDFQTSSTVLAFQTGSLK
ncbi:MAG TPA: TolC family protein [Terriglobales bacterium]|nr:TolC family protein [Terriglobales bacterium]